MTSRFLFTLPGALLVAAVLVPAAMTRSALAQVYCSEPISPSCVSVDSTSRDSLSVQRCKQDVEDFADDVTEYLDCLDKNAVSLKEKVADMRGEIKKMEKQTGSGNGQSQSSDTQSAGTASE